VSGRNSTTIRVPSSSRALGNVNLYYRRVYWRALHCPIVTCLSWCCRCVALDGRVLIYPRHPKIYFGLSATIAVHVSHFPFLHEHLTTDFLPNRISNSEWIIRIAIIWRVYMYCWMYKLIFCSSFVDLENYFRLKYLSILLSFLYAFEI